MKKISTLIVSLLIIGLVPQFATGQDLSTTNTLEKPKSVLRLGLSAYDRYGQELGFELNYERFITPRLGIKASLYHNLRLKKSSSVEGRAFSLGGLTSFTDYNQVANVSFALNYYFKKNSQSGHYLSLQIMDALTFTDRSEYTVDASSSTMGPSIFKKDKRVFNSSPDIGLYYGYRKEFKSGLFLEGRVGVYYGNTSSNLSLPYNNWSLDAQLTIGWTIPFTKKK
ncbi:hypothetical protein [Roseivirga sp. E12]|uniref:hypothetical protein n=1 Tax=Roseivirga sp. E12 TaxID=2819237 RepID=UPI001ABC2A99|nr:hypothetical protein [Roseivirga sp. E12]MBO3697441.1 hypothetical protein [Roseivirga sp. E12]